MTCSTAIPCRLTQIAAATAARVGPGELIGPLGGQTASSSGVNDSAPPVSEFDRAVGEHGGEDVGVGHGELDVADPEADHALPGPRPGPNGRSRSRVSCW